MTNPQSDTTPLRRLDFALIGAQKCATSWMYYCLLDHPQVCVPDKKLEAGYIGGPMFAEKGEDWFFDRFHCAEGQVKGDVSVEYLFDLGTPEALARYMAPEPKLVVSLRNPVDRMVSGYFWLIRRGILPNLPIEEGLAPVLAQRPGFPDPLDGPLEEVVRRSCYGPQLAAFAARFGPDALCVVLYDDVVRDGLGTIRRIYDFLGVDAGFTPPSLKSAPKRNAYNPLLLALENRFGKSKVVAKLINYTNQALLALRPSERRDVLPGDDRRRLEALFAPCVEKTAEALGRLTLGQRPDPDTLRRLWGAK
jgi:hypothetical protein